MVFHETHDPYRCHYEDIMFFAISCMAIMWWFLYVSHWLIHSYQYVFFLIVTTISVRASEHSFLIHLTLFIIYIYEFYSYMHKDCYVCITCRSDILSGGTC